MKEKNCNSEFKRNNSIATEFIFVDKFGKKAKKKELTKK